MPRYVCKKNLIAHLQRQSLINICRQQAGRQLSWASMLMSPRQAVITDGRHLGTIYRKALCIKNIITKLFLFTASKFLKVCAVVSVSQKTVFAGSVCCCAPNSLAVLGVLTGSSLVSHSSLWSYQHSYALKILNIKNTVRWDFEHTLLPSPVAKVHADVLSS